ncbi:TPA: hypothetical protein EYP66_10240 [Candidatus Poribacteria bacterium]|nr:hypothetical protein [Candidatus Poribacteria bacterium]
MSQYKVGISVLACLLVLGCAKPPPPPPVLPISREARIVESTTPAEIMVEASGIGRDVDEALLDARRSAVAVVLIGGSDPLLETQEERSRFKLIQEEFYAAPSVNQYITWEAGWEARESKQIKIEGGNRTKVTKHFKVNKRMLQDEMVRRGIMKPPEEVEDAMGRPNIDVIPKVLKGEDPIAAMNDNPALRHAAQAIGSYLSARDYEYEDIEQKINMDDFVDAQQALAGIGEDDSHKLALAAGGDIYITFTAEVQEAGTARGIAGKKAIVGITAYETTTARSLGTETGYSPLRPGTAELSLIEEAVSGAIDNVLSRINAYWKKDMKQGVQYRVVISIVGDFDKDEREDIAFAMNRVMKKICKFTKENIATDQTLDYQVWVSPQEISDSRELYGLLRRDFPVEFRPGKLRSVHLFKKLIILQVNNAE